MLEQLDGVEALVAGAAAAEGVWALLATPKPSPGPCACSPIVCHQRHTIAPATPHRISLITNPATDAIQLNTSGINGQWLGWYLFTAQGQIAASGKIIGAESLSIPLPALPSGLYFFSLSGMETPFSVKIIVAQQP